MNERVKQLWIDALRGGQFKQGSHRLWTGTAYCCLGVLCELASREGVLTRSEWMQGRVLPEKVMRWADIPRANPMIEHEGRVASLAERNDGTNADRMDFYEIADLIEHNL